MKNKRATIWSRMQPPTMIDLNTRLLVSDLGFVQEKDDTSMHPEASGEMVLPQDEGLSMMESEMPEDNS
ncbi:hypothetical protein AAHA92_28093 [Salvia divinorum]|uniref:Uncharacterized protein n=1 Tax=Salvia divinorum TaxID=28513 RepID=A0ABD1G6W8_SALDI